MSVSQNAISSIYHNASTGGFVVQVLLPAYSILMGKETVCIASLPMNRDVARNPSKEATADICWGRFWSSRESAVTTGRLENYFTVLPCVHR